MITFAFEAVELTNLWLNMENYSLMRSIYLIYWRL